MNGDNTSHSNSMDFRSIEIMKFWLEFYSDHPAVASIISFLFDLIPALFGSVFTVRFYRGIEIDHPLYAIILMNIVLSTFSSYFSFIFHLFESNANYSIVTHILYFVISSFVFSIVSSFLIIASIRYYLLVYVKKDTYFGEVDIINLRNIALIGNIILFICISLIRGTLTIALALEYDTAKVKICVFTSVICFTVVPLLLTLLLDYKIDKHLENEHNRNDYQVSQPSLRHCVNQHLVSLQLETEDRNMRNHKQNNGNEANYEFCANVNRENKDDGRKKYHSRYAWQHAEESGIQITNEGVVSNEKYGGIYIGAEPLNCCTEIKTIEYKENLS